MIKKNWRFWRWAGWGSLGLVLAVVLVMAGGLGWLAVTYTRGHPLDLLPYLPKIQKYFLADGVRLEVGKLEVFYDDSPVVRASDVAIYGGENEPGIYVEQAAIKLSNHKFVAFNFAPKVIEAKGVTLRLLRTERGISVAGFAKMQSDPGKKDNDSFVTWLNSLSSDSAWGSLKDVKLDKANVLLRDDVLQTEWVLEQGRLAFNRYADDGEHGAMTAKIRRLYGTGGSQAFALDRGSVMPVLVSFDHRKGEDEAYLSVKFDRTDARIVADYFPPQFQDLLKARGSVEVGTVILPGNALGRPYVTLRLADVKVTPPEGFSSAIEIPKLTTTVSYVPSPTDVMDVQNLVMLTKRGNIWHVKGRIEHVTGDAFLKLAAMSDGGDVQGIFDFFPDQPPGMKKALAFVRPNIKDARYTSLTAVFEGRPSSFPHCADACGVVEIRAGINGGRVKFMPEFSEAVISGTALFSWSGQRFSVVADEAKLGNQKVSGLGVMLTDIFSVSPTRVLVSGTLAGDFSGVINELRGVDREKRLPRDIAGVHSSFVNVDVPLPRGRDPEFREVSLSILGAVSRARVGGLPELGNAVFSAPKMRVDLLPGKLLRVSSDGTLGTNPLDVVWEQGIDEGQHNMRLLAKGSVDGKWLLERLGKPDGVVLDGVVEVSASVAEQVSGSLVFDASGAMDRAALKVSALGFEKKKGEALSVAVVGSSSAGGKKVSLENMKVSGPHAYVLGRVSWNTDVPDATLAELKPLRLGKTDVTVDYANKRAVVRGSRLDMSGYDLFADDSKSSEIKDLNLDVQVGELLMKGGLIRNASALVEGRGGVWDINAFSGTLDKGERVNVVRRGGSGGPSKLTVNVDNLGKTLKTLGAYDALERGRMWGDIVYASPKSGKGTMKIEDFELRNPPVLVKLLSLLSLEQLLAGTDTVLFSHATLPIKIQGNSVELSGAKLEGPSMSLQLDGSYIRGTKELNMDGKMAPAIPFNRLVSEIPLIGTLLTGSQDGVVVADFKVKGTTDDIQINVRPLSVITPGLLKDFWRGITGK